MFMSINISLAFIWVCYPKTSDAAFHQMTKWTWPWLTFVFHCPSGIWMEYGPYCMVYWNLGERNSRENSIFGPHRIRCSYYEFKIISGLNNSFFNAYNDLLDFFATNLTVLHFCTGQLLHMIPFWVYRHFTQAYSKTGSKS